MLEAEREDLAAGLDEIVAGMPALLPAHHQRVASRATIKNDFADPLPA
jgi:hypothetical protein